MNIAIDLLIFETCIREHEKKWRVLKYEIKVYNGETRKYFNIFIIDPRIKFSVKAKESIEALLRD